MPVNKVSPVSQEYDRISVSTGWSSGRSLYEYRDKDSRSCPTRRCFCITCVVLLILGLIATVLTVGILYGIPTGLDSFTRQCKTASNKTGFLCDDRVMCIAASKLCDGKVDCGNGEDEAAQYCGNLPNSLPENLVFKCANKRSWTYTDKLCDTRNDCGDCSDEAALRCPVCSGWRCNTVFFADCDCIPKSRCRDNVQDCTDWSDEKSC
ncbi:low-density lipoprotein receptor class A domain-containing protein 1 [Bombina bombina]|uniref:low-density lipoprotein receptor class A domain-containing protein 1 n=1 Tax=Bombina bombina TaxID=8345 RepID=UPI00235AF886|nr:low-density lipoprotein receptor class A domain-containing protein 1 [Bombina bombina]XP_053557404.1 low-density lipoprotein receptor class A domain-containing protein 1 [Bombina bombina]XP_053557405.1 low-density lipoprotein receptor class A domain-containing protein 1 [Bombina bombina]